MNISPVISLPVAEDLSTYQYELVKLTSTGIARCTSVNDRAIGSLLLGNNAAANGQTIPTTFAPVADVLLIAGNGVHFVKVGNDTAIAMGDELEQDATDGRIVKRTSGEAIGVAVDSCPASSDGGVIRAILFQQNASGTKTMTLTAATTLVAADSGATIWLNSATEFAVTLPAHAAGLRFKFLVKAAPSGADYTVTNATGTTIVGQITTNDFSGTTDSDFEASGAATITFVQAKAVKGDWVEVISDGTNWYATGACSVFDAITIS